MNGDAHLYWAIILMAIALVLFFVEMFIPSGGVLSVLALIALGAGVFLLFKVNTTAGLIGAIAALIALPVAIAFGIRILPSTPLMKLMTLGAPQQETELGEHGIAGGHGHAERKELIGVEGQAVTDLRPIGTCMIDGRRRDCLAVGGMIKTGSKVRVVAADGLQVKVEEVA